MDAATKSLGNAFALQQAKAHGNEKAVSELSSIAPYPGTKLTLDRIVLFQWRRYIRWDILVYHY
jgi:hypothetical protein